MRGARSRTRRRCQQKCIAISIPLRPYGTSVPNWFICIKQSGHVSAAKNAVAIDGRTTWEKENGAGDSARILCESGLSKAV